MDDEMLIRLKLVPEGYQEAVKDIGTSFKGLSDEASKIFAKQDMVNYKKQLMDSSESIKSSLANAKSVAMQTAAEIQKAAVAEIKGNNDAKQAMAGKLTSMKDLKAIQMETIRNDEKSLKTIGEATREQQRYSTAVKDAAASIKQKDLVLRSVEAVENKMIALQEKINKGEIDYAEANKRALSSAKATYQELQAAKERLAAVKSTGDTKAIKDAETEIKNLSAVYKKAATDADEFAHAQDRLKGEMRPFADKMIAGSEALTKFGANLTAVAGGFGEFGKLPGLVSNSVGQAFAELEKLESKSNPFEKFMAGANIAVMAAGVAKQVIDIFDGMIRKTEQAVIDKGKAATTKSNIFKSYELENQALQGLISTTKDATKISELNVQALKGRMTVVDKIAESDQRMASSLRAVASDAEKFQERLDKLNAKLRETREAGLGMEWKTEAQGGGLLGWLKSLGSHVDEFAANMGKARVALDEFRQATAQGAQNFMEGMTAATSYTKSVYDRIDQMTLKILQNQGKVKEARAFELKQLDEEKETTRELIKLKIQQNEQLERQALIERTKLATAMAENKKIYKETYFVYVNPWDNIDTIAGNARIFSDLDKLSQGIKDYSQKHAVAMGKIASQIKTAVSYSLLEASDDIEKASETVNDKIKSLLQSNYGFSQTTIKALLDNEDTKLYVKTLLELTPAMNEATKGLGQFKSQNVKLNDELKNLDQTFKDLKASQEALWASEDAKNKKEPAKPKPTALDKFTAPQLANVEKEVSYWLDILKKRYESWGDGIDTAKVKKAITDRTKELAEYIAKDNTLQDALKAQQTKLADLEKQLPSLTGSARTEAEKQIKETRGSITSLTDELNAALTQTAHLRADLILASQEAVKDVANLESMTAIQNQTKDWQAEIDKIMKGYDKLSDAGKLAAQTQIAAINAVINSLADQSTTLAVSARKAVEAAKTVNDGLEASYNKAKEAYDAAHDMRTQAQKDEDAYQKSLKDTADYYDKQIKALKDKGIVGTSDIKALEDMRDQALELIEDTRQLTLEAQAYQEQIAKTNEMWSNLSKTVDDASKIHLDWLKIFDPKGYEQTMAAMAKATLDTQISGIMGMRDALEKEMIATGDSEAFRNKVKEVTKGMLVLTGDKKADWEALWKFFNMTANEAANLAGYTFDANGNMIKLVATVKEGAAALSGFAAQLKEAGEKANELFNWKPTFDLQGFLTDYDKAIKGVQSNVYETITDKFNSDMKGLNDALDKSIKDANKTFNDWLSNREKGMTDAQKKEFEMSDEYYAKLQETNNKIIELSQDTAEKRLEIARKNALDLAAAYKVEFDKLESMQKSFNDRMQARDKLTGNARVEVADYVARSKMTNAQKEADDLTKQLADQYQKYLTAGMKDSELQEWLAIRKKELLTGKDKETTAEFEKQWAIRAKAAQDYAKLEREAFDAETKRLQDALDTQTKLVNQLKTNADAARDSLIQMLIQLGAVASEVGKIVTPGQSGFTPIQPVGSGGKLIPEPTGYTLKQGDLYSKVKGMLSESQKPSPAMIAEIGVAGVTDLEYRNGAWARYRAAGTATPPPPATGSGLQDNPKAVPVETSAEINARIEAYKLLETTATTVFNNLSSLYKTFNENIKEVFELLKPKATDQWVKELIGAMGGLGKDIVKEFKKPFIDEFDPVYGNGLGKKMGDYGKNLVDQLAYGMSRAANTLKTEVLKLIAIAIEPYLKSNSPPKEGPLHFIDKWGYNVGETYTLSMGQGITEGTVWINQGLTDTANTIKKSSKIMAEYAPKTLGMSTMEGTTELKALQDLYGQLTKDSTVAGMWSAREKQYVSRDLEFGAYSQGLNLASNKANIEKQTSELAIEKTQDKVNTFYKWFNKGLLSPDMGDLNESLVRQQIGEHPELASWYWYTKKLEQQYPEVYKNLVADGTIKPTATTTITDTKTGEILGRSQTGNMFDKYSVDYLETNFQGATGFNDWLQTKFNKWLKSNESMVDPTTGKSIGYGSYDVVTQRDKFLEGWSENRLSDLVTEYQNYVKELGTVKSFEELQGQLSEKYAGTELAKSLATGKSLDESLIKNKFSDILLTGKDKETAFDKTVVSGGGWYKDGKEIYDKDLIAKLSTKGGGGISGAKWEHVLIDRQAAIRGAIRSGQIQDYFGKMRDLFGGNDWQFGWFEFDHVQFWLPYAVMKIKVAQKINSSNLYDAKLTPMSESDAVKLFGAYELKKMRERGEWPYILQTASREQKTGNFSSINEAVQKEIDATLGEIKTLVYATKGTGGSTEGDITAGYEYKNKYTTTKGDYGYGVSKLSQLAGGLDDDRRKAILDAMVSRIDETYQNKSIGTGQEQVGGGLVSGDYRKVTENRTIDYSMVRDSMKTRLAEALGFNKEYAVARGWRNAMDANAGEVANEEILKWVEYTRDEIIKRSPKLDVMPVGEDQNVAETRAYLQELVKDGVTPEKLDAFKQALNMATQLGFISREQAASLVQEVLPDAVKIAEQIGLTTFRGGTKEIEGFSWVDALLKSPWGSEQFGYGQEGQRQLLGEYADLDPVIQKQYAQAYAIKANAFDYYERMTPGYQQPIKWSQYGQETQYMPQEGYPEMIGMNGPMMPPSPTGIMMNSKVSTFSSGSGNTFYFAFNIDEMNVENGTDFAEQLKDTLGETFEKIGVPL